MNNFSKGLEDYTIPNQKTSPVAEALITYYFCHFGVPQELRSDQCCNFESHLMQEIFQRLGVSKTHTTSL
jgi:hypothetical protein